MSETTLSVLLFIHVMFIAIWVGSQVLVAVAVVPSLRRVQDGRDRVAALSAVTRRFNFVAWTAMLVIVLTGGVMAAERIDDIEQFVGSIYDVRWGFVFAIKMGLWVVMVGLVGLHSFMLGPRQLELNREAVLSATEGDAAEVRAELRGLQRRSVLISAGGLLLSVLVLGCGAFLANHGYSFELV